MPTVYIETNFVVGYAVGQRTKHDAILQAASDASVELRIPEVCIMEAFAAIDRKLNEYNLLGNSIRSRLKQLRDSVSSSVAATAVSTLESALLDLASVDADVLTRRDSVLSGLAANATFFSIDLAWFSQRPRRTMIDPPRDSIIADAVIQDAKKEAREAVFYTENKADFDTPVVRAALLASGVRLTDDLNVTVAYIEGLKSWNACA